MAVAGGIGASVGNTGSINFDRVSVSGVHSSCFWGRVHSIQISFQLSHEFWCIAHPNFAAGFCR